MRPISGVTHTDDNKDRQSSISKGNGGDEGDEQHVNYNLQALMELDEQRQTIKKNIATFQEEQRKKQAAEEKKAAKK